MQSIPNLYKPKPAEEVFVHAVPSEDGTRMVGKLFYGKLDANNQPIEEPFDCSKEEFEAKFKRVEIDPEKPMQLGFGAVLNPGDPGFEEAIAAHKASGVPDGAALKAAAIAKAQAAQAEIVQAPQAVAGEGTVA